MRTDPEELKQEAERFIYTCYEELGYSREDAEARLVVILADIAVTGTYTHTKEELEHGCKMAWRNSNRCIGRLFWDKLRIVDAREVDTAGQAAEAILSHIRTASNGGKVIPMITIMAPEGPHGAPVRIWNHQLVRYAGYETGNGIVGDPASVEMTKVAMSLGWQGAGTPYDVLPIIVQSLGQTPEWFEVPREDIVEVRIEHPDRPEMTALDLRWYGVPMIADMRLEIGGISYPAAPFNGWYMGTEIGARNLADTFRYNKLPAVAKAFGMDTSSETTLWKDRALVELNVAVLHSFKKAGVSIVDHHTAASQFALFEQREAQAGRELTGDWTWLIPPVSPATTHIFHKPYRNKRVKPNFFHQEKAYSSEAEAASSEDAPMKCPFAH